MSSEEIFYDSLEEDNNEDETFFIDITECVPLYTGDTPKNQILNQKRKIKKNDLKLLKPLENSIKPKKTYLTMYYAKKYQFEGKNNEDGSNTSRAFCEKLSPKRDFDLDNEFLNDINEKHFSSENSSDEDE